MPAATLDRLEFDSALFGRPMAILRLAPDAAIDLPAALDAAVRDGYRYLICRPAIDDAAAIHALGSAGFYLSDQGVTWSIETAAYGASSGGATDGIVAATLADVPALQDIARSMFLDSRFYNDPFFSVVEAERMHAEWIKNSVLGTAADVVLWRPAEGFVTLKQRAATGEIVLIGVTDARRRRGAGRSLLSAAMAWFRGQQATQVTVRTQLRNIRASRFYQAQGFALAGADVTFSRIL